MLSGAQFLSHGMLLISVASAQSQEERRSAIRDAFEMAWQGYYKYAFPHDELHPVDNTWDNDRNGWGATAFDALDTAIIMERGDIVSQILDFVPTVDWAVSYENMTVSLFETNIRYLGGMLAAYDLLTGPYQKMSQNLSSKANVLKTQAINLANNLSFAFETNTGIPYNGLNLATRSHVGDPTNGLSGIGTLVLEWTRLSEISGNATYGQLAQKAESYLLDPQPSSDEPWPGLVGMNINITTGDFITDMGTWDGGGDSFYEYLIKMYVHDSNKFGHYKDRWVAAADSTIANIGSHPIPRPSLTFLADWQGTFTENMTGNLACFAGGNFILGGLVLNEPKYIDFGRQLTDSCSYTFTVEPTHIGVAGWQWNASDVPSDQQAYYEKNGFWQTNTGWPLRPEVLESIYYAWRATGNETYRDWSWNTFLALNSTCRVGSGFSGINNVQVAGGGGFDNVQQTWFFAGTLKYLYLTQSGDDLAVQTNYQGANDFVFNTEAHPLRVAGTPV